MLSTLKALLGSREGAVRTRAVSLYAKCVKQARSPAFYDVDDLSDTPETRFELIALSLSCLLLKLEETTADDEGFKLRRKIQEIYFADMDQSLREMGVGDLMVGKKVQAMAAAFFQRLKDYQFMNEPALARMIILNVYRHPLTDDENEACPQSIQDGAAFIASFFVSQFKSFGKEQENDIAVDSWRFLAP